MLVKVTTMVSEMLYTFVGWTTFVLESAGSLDIWALRAHPNDAIRNILKINIELPKLSIKYMAVFE